MSVPHQKNYNPAAGGPAGVIGTFSVSHKQPPYKPQTLSPAHDRAQVDFTGFVLPRRRAPFIFLIAVIIACIGAMFMIDPIAPLNVPAAQPYIPPVIVAVPAAVPSEIDEIASLLPQAVAAPMPVDKQPRSKNTSSTRPRVTVTDSKPQLADRVGSLTRSAIAAARAGQRDKALALFTEARQLAPNDTHALYNVAVLHDKMGNTEQAADAYRQVMANPTPGQGIDYRRVAARITQLQDLIVQQDEALIAAETE